VFRCFFIALLGGSSLYGASLRLQNETACPLRALVQSADGSALGDVIVPPQDIQVWETGTLHKHLTANKSLTPFSVTWLCMDGELFGVQEQISTGALASTKQCSGKKNCKKVEESPRE